MSLHFVYWWWEITEALLRRIALLTLVLSPCIYHHLGHSTRISVLLPGLLCIIHLCVFVSYAFKALHFYATHFHNTACRCQQPAQEFFHSVNITFLISKMLDSVTKFIFFFNVFNWHRSLKEVFFFPLNKSGITLWAQSTQAYQKCRLPISAVLMFRTNKPLALWKLQIGHPYLCLEQTSLYLMSSDSHELVSVVSLQGEGGRGIFHP